jgi:hypothetical protein
MSARPAPERFLSGESGTRSGWSAYAHALADLGISGLRRVTGASRAIDRLADACPPRRVLVLSVYRANAQLARAVSALSSTRHSVLLALGAIDEPDPALRARTVAAHLRLGRLENLNVVLELVPPLAGFDWVLVVDDDVDFPERFVDRFVALCEAFAFELAQPAQTRRSHAAWSVTRVRPASVARVTRFVEIGPVTAFGSAAARELLPFPAMRYGWGVDLWWAALASDRNWRLGVVDGVPVRHERAAVATAYDRDAAIEEARTFLASRPFLEAIAAQSTLTTYRRVPRAVTPAREAPAGPAR